MLHGDGIASTYERSHFTLNGCRCVFAIAADRGSRQIFSAKIFCFVLFFSILATRFYGTEQILHITQNINIIIKGVNWPKFVLSTQFTRNAALHNMQNLLSLYNIKLKHFDLVTYFWCEQQI